MVVWLTKGLGLFTAAFLLVISPRPAGAEQDLSLERIFHRALASYMEGNLGEAADEFLSLQNAGKELGYKNLPEYSVNLLALAEEAESENRDNVNSDEKVRFLVHQALLLSPDDGRIQLCALKYFQALGVLDWLRNLLQGTQGLFHFPSLMWGLAANTILLVLVSVTLAMFLACVIHLCKNCASIQTKISNTLPFRWRQSCGPPLCLAIFLLPLGGGILVSIAVWSAILSKLVDRCRNFMLFAAILTIGWAVGLPSSVLLRANLEHPAVRFVERLRNESYSPSDLPIIRRALQEAPNSPLLLLALGKTLSLEAYNEEAKSVLKSLFPLPDVDPEVAASALVNLGVLEYRAGRLDEALSYLTQAGHLGDQTPERYFNLSLVSMAQLNTEQYRDYYAQATRSDSKRVMALSENEEVQKNGVLPRLSYPYVSQLLTARRDSWGGLSRKIDVHFHQLVRCLIRFGGIQFTLVLGVGLLVFGLRFVFTDVKARWGTKSSDSSEPLAAQLVWATIPGGLALAGARPISGVALFSMFTLTLMLGMGTPVQPVSLLPMELANTGFYITLAIAMVLLPTVAALYKAKRSLQKTRSGRK